MRTCLFGGTFDPVHTGHLAIARAAADQLALDRVVFLPAAQSPFKTGDQTLFAPQQRVDMLRAALANWPQAEVSELDLHMEPPSWSWRVVEAWLAKYPADELHWLLGADEWEQLHRWARLSYLAEHLTFVVYNRGQQLQPRPEVNAVFLSGPVYEVSATELRRRLKRHLPVPVGWMSPEVETMAHAMCAERSNETKPTQHG